jgi:hypothetical protein
VVVCGAMGGQRRDAEGTAPAGRKSARWRGWWWRAKFTVFSCCVLFFCSSSVTRNGHLVLLLDRQCVGYTITSSNQVAADSLFLSCLPKNYFPIISAFFKISQIVVFPCMTARKYSWNGGGGKAQGEGREI